MRFTERLNNVYFQVEDITEMNNPGSSTDQYPPNIYFLMSPTSLPPRVFYTNLFYS